MNARDVHQPEAGLSQTLDDLRRPVWLLAERGQHGLQVALGLGPACNGGEGASAAHARVGGQEALAADLLDAVRHYARIVDGTLLVPADYLEVVAVRA